MKTKKKEKRSWKNDKNSSQSAVSGSDSDELKDIECDLTDYAGDCIKLMSEVFKILGDKKLKQMMPSLLKPITMEDLKASLVEESMALSKKRIISILNGTTYSSSSSETDEEAPAPNQEIDVVSLDGITDDSDVFCWDDYSDDTNANNKQSKHLKKKRTKKTKKPKGNTSEGVTVKTEKPTLDEKAITALELLELQARARAIKSQLALESTMTCINNESDEEVIKTEPPKIKADLEKDDSNKTTETPAPAPKKVKLRRNHLRLDPNRTTGTAKVVEDKQQNDIIEPNVETIKLEELEEAVPEKKRRHSTDSIILESPPRSLIVISSEDEHESKNKKPLETNTPSSDQENESQNSLEKNTRKESSCEEGEITDETTTDQPKSPSSPSKNDNIDCSSQEQTIDVGKSVLDPPDPDCIVIDSEPEFDTDLEEELSDPKPKSVSNDNENLDETSTWKLRWLDSKKVQNVLQTSKLCNNVKRKISLKKDLAENAEPCNKSTEESTTTNIPEGTVEQFNALHKKSEENKTMEKPN